MEKKYLIINIGSASKRYALYENNKEKFSAYFEKDELNISNFNASCQKFFKSIDKNEIKVIGLRIVAPGSYFRKSKVIDENYLINLKKAKEKAPLHIKPVIEEIKRLKDILPNIPIIGISDSEFHLTLPEHSFFYNIPKEDAQKIDIFRFGYHGISAQYILRKIKEKEKSIPSNIIIAHLGGGASITAVKNGKSFDTSMGMTPLEGLPMTTRSGNIDAGAVIQLAKEKKINFDKLGEYLNTKCGLYGLSGNNTGNVKELLELEKDGNKDAILALQIFIYNIKKYIGSYVVALGGLDMLILSGTINERSSIIRKRVLKDLECIGIEIDENKNNNLFNNNDYIESATSKVRVYIAKINELEEIAFRTSELL